jgi:biofilm PGA synthesis N-glycosyltransferase PgaC
MAPFTAGDHAEFDSGRSVAIAPSGTSLRQISEGTLRITFRRRPAATVEPDHDECRIAVLIASKDGGSTVGATIRSVREQADVFLVSDGSLDETAAIGRNEGACVLELEQNVGKPAAIYRALRELSLTERYDAVAILDDDTVVAPDFISRARGKMVEGVAIVVGRTITRWEHKHRWNVWLGSRAYSYWRYQATLRRGQSALGVMNSISGSNSVYRSSLLDSVVVEKTPYIVDDTYWTLETQRRKLGRIVYAPEAHAWICDPLTLRDWYRQNLRWIWGMYQGIVGHGVGRRRSLFDISCLLMMIDWAFYVFGLPALVGLTIWLDWFSLHLVIVYFAGYLGWTTLAAVATGKWRIVVMTPAIMLIDVIYRITFVHALVKTIREPRVSTCRWVSPARY